MKKLIPGNLLFLLVLLSACNNDNKGSSDKNEATSEKTSDTKPVAGNNIIQFTVDGKSVTTSGWTISRFDFGSGTGTSVNVTSNMHEEPQTININIVGDHAGTYPLESGLSTSRTAGTAYGSYTPDYMKDMSNHYSFKNGEFTITSIDTTAGLLNATFHGTAKNMKGDSVIITDGKVINGKLKAGITRLN